jgi:DnaJ-class molecular chaperone
MDIDFLDAVRANLDRAPTADRVWYAAAPAPGWKQSTTCPECRAAHRPSSGPYSFADLRPLHGDANCQRSARHAGTGRVTRPDTIRVNIPPGAEPGKRNPAARQGEAGVRGGPAGDLYITPRIRPHPILRARGDLTMELPITVGEAVRGAEVEVPTPGGAIKVKIPAGAQSGQQLRIRGRGVAAHGQTPAGDLFLRLMVRVPKERIADEVIDKIDRAYSDNVRKDVRL